MRKKLQRIKTVIVIFAVLLAFGLAALAGILIFGQPDLPIGSASAPDNYIKPTNSDRDTSVAESRGSAMPVMLCASPLNISAFRSIPLAASSKTIIDSDSAKETVISIYKRHAQDSEPFRVFNMFPGDSHTKAYFIEVSHKGTVTVRFRANIRDGHEKLAEVLKCKVVLRGENKPLYDGLMRDIPSSLNCRISAMFSRTTKLTYDITVYLDTSVGNEYMNKELVADFCWWVNESGSDPTPPTDTDDTDGTDTADGTDDSSYVTDTADPSDTTDRDPDDGELVSPETGVNVHFCIWFWIAMISIFINLILLRPGRWIKDGKQEDKTSNEK